MAPFSGINHLLFMCSVSQMGVTPEAEQPKTQRTVKEGPLQRRSGHPHGFEVWIVDSGLRMGQNIQSEVIETLGPAVVWIVVP